VSDAADGHAGLRGELVGARLQSDDAVSLTQLLDREAANVALDRPRSDRRPVEPVPLTLRRNMRRSIHSVTLVLCNQQSK